MFHRTSRIKRKEFPAWNTPKQVYTHGCFRWVFFQRATSTPKIAIVIPKKYVALSVDRHRLKRQISAQLEQVIANKQLPGVFLLLQLTEKCPILETSQLHELIQHMITDRPWEKRS